MIDLIPSDVASVCQLLYLKGYSVHIVGGAVRDLLRGSAVGDFDVATSAKPEQVAELFPKVIETGVKHGTVTVMTSAGKPIEVTTYRTENQYADGRHPDSVEFVGSIEQDLARRDFTINAIALSFPGGQIVDPFDGRTDLIKGVIRTVGDSSQRFFEDGLRLLRACRFAATLEFEIERSTLSGMSYARRQLACVSPERQRDELIKTLSAAQPSRAFVAARDAGILEIFLPELQLCVGCVQNSWHSFDVFEHTLKVLDDVDKGNLALRFAALFHDIGKPISVTEEAGERHFFNHEKASAEIAKNILTRLKCPNALIDPVVSLISEHMWFYEENWSDTAVRRFVRRIGGPASVADAFALRRADILGRGRKDLEKGELELTARFLKRVNNQIDNNNVFSIRDLPINGRDVMETLEIAPGPKVGEVLHWLLEKIEAEPEKSSRLAAIELVSKEFGKR